MAQDWRPEQARKSLERILPEMETVFAADIAADLLAGELHDPEEGLRRKGYQSVWLDITAERPGAA